MAELKTKFSNDDVYQFIDSFASSELKKQESLELIERMKKISGQEPRMWGTSIIGFGSYHYKYASGHEGDAPLLGFSPRKAAFSLYVFTGLEEHMGHLENLGKYTMGKACIYVKKLADINLDELEKVMSHTTDWLKKTYQ